MICILLLMGNDEHVACDISSELLKPWTPFVDMPKALLPGINGMPFLTQWWHSISQAQLFANVVLVANASNYKHFERWATANSFRRENIVNNGVAATEGRPGGNDIDDFRRVMRSRMVDDDVVVLTGDMVCHVDDFELQSVIEFFNKKRGNVAVYYNSDREGTRDGLGRVTVEGETAHVTGFSKQSLPEQVESRLCAPLLCLRRDTLPFLDIFTASVKEDNPSLGDFLGFLTTNSTVYAFGPITEPPLIGRIGLAEYIAYVTAAPRKEISTNEERPSIVHRAYARVGLVGNPSDGFHGATLSASIRNYWAEVSLTPSPVLSLAANPLHDPNAFGSLHDLWATSEREGYMGGRPLMQATCKRFYEHCAGRDIVMHKGAFRLAYNTNIPRQVGLSGSSAIVVATLKCLLEFYDVSPTLFPLEMQPTFCLSVETELGIAAGLQDRVIQVYEGVVFMDFDKDMLASRGHGKYVRIDSSLLPPLWLAYLAEPKHSGKVHSPMKARWEARDPVVVEGMKVFRQLTLQAVEALQRGDWTEFGKLMDANFDQRVKLYGPEAIQQASMAMIETGRRHGAHVKFPGSGNAVVGVLLDPKKRQALREELEANGCVFCDIIVKDPDV